MLLKWLNDQILGRIKMKRCLIVDDSQVIRKVAKRILTDSGLSVEDAASGAEAIEICRQEMPDVITVDSLLPDMDSFDLIARLYNLNPENRPFIVLSTHQLDTAQVIKARRAGAKEHMLKPFIRQQLLDNFRKFGLLNDAL